MEWQVSFVDGKVSMSLEYWDRMITRFDHLEKELAEQNDQRRMWKIAYRNANDKEREVQELLLIGLYNCEIISQLQFDAGMELLEEEFSARMESK